MFKTKIVILYGNGGDLGNLEVFAQGIRRQLPPGLEHQDVILKRIVRKQSFFDFVEKFTTNYVATIRELHIVSHAIGAGLFPGYHDAAVDRHRKDFLLSVIKQNRRVTYEEVVDAEIGGILCDDFRRPNIRTRAERFRAAMAPAATIKLWGCNSGVVGWVYNDNGEANPAVVDDNIPFWWRALNLKNTPKPAVAQAFADFFQRRTFGATSGAHVEVLHHGKWVKSAKYKAEVHKWPSPRLVHRLHPDPGVYEAYDPGLLP